MTTGERYLLEPQVVERLAAYGLPYPEHGLARNAQEAAQIAARIGYPVVLKIVSADVVHKSEAGGVAVGLENGAQVRAGFEALLARTAAAVPGVRLAGVLVCKEAPPGLEVIVGVLDDATFGPAVMFGLGGIFAEVLQDVSFRVAPLARRDVDEMLRETKGYALLDGARGRPPLDVEALAELLLAVSRLAMDCPDVGALDLNPVRVYEEGVMVLDARLMVKGG